jgi:hypothetical protein
MVALHPEPLGVACNAPPVRESADSPRESANRRGGCGTSKTEDSHRNPPATRCIGIWWSGTASIRRPPVFQTGALPTELPDLTTDSRRNRLAGTTGFEPATSGLTGRRTLQTVLRALELARESGLTVEVYLPWRAAQHRVGSMVSVRTVNWSRSFSWLCPRSQEQDGFLLLSGSPPVRFWRYRR